MKYDRETYKQALEEASVVYKDLKEEARRTERLVTAHKELKDKILRRINLDVKDDIPGFIRRHKESQKEKKNKEKETLKKEKKGDYKPDFKALIEGVRRVNSKNNDERIKMEMKGRGIEEEIRDRDRVLARKRGVNIDVNAEDEVCLVVRAKLGDGERDKSERFELGEEIVVTKRALTRLDLIDVLIRLEDRD